MNSAGPQFDILNFSLIFIIIFCISLTSPVMIISSTYKPMMHLVLLFFEYLNIHFSDFICLNPFLFKKFVIVWFHCLPDCFNPYIALLSFQNPLPKLVSPNGIVVYISVSNGGLRYAALISNW